MSIYELPTSLTIGGVGYSIRADFRPVIDILIAISDENLDDEWKAFTVLKIFYPEWSTIPPEHLQEAIDKAFQFIDYDQIEKPQCKQNHRLYDWEQDARMVVSAVNKVAGMEVRAQPFLHWWTFLGYFYEIGEGTFATVVGIRSKKAKGKKLDKWEKDFVKENRDLIKLKQKSAFSEQEKDELRALFGLK